jgi:hypothetical protein
VTPFVQAKMGSDEGILAPTFNPPQPRERAAVGHGPSARVA